MQKYIVFILFRSPIIAIPDLPIKIKLRCISNYPASTAKKKVVKFFFLVLIIFRLDLIFFKSASHSQEEFIFYIQSELFNENSLLTFIWGTNPVRPRVYIYENDLLNSSSSFTKLYLSEKNFNSLVNEEKAMKFINLEASIYLPSIEIPKVIGSGLNRYGRYLTTTRMPENSKLVRHNKISFFDLGLDVIQKESKTIPFNKLNQVQWWSNYMHTINEVDFFHSNLVRLKPETIFVTNIHGDLGSENIFLVNEKLWIIDWERFSREGPHLTDQIAYWLGSMAKYFSSYLSKVTHDFKVEFIDKQEHELIDVMLAIAYLHSANFNLATSIATNWKRIN